MTMSVIRSLGVLILVFTRYYIYNSNTFKFFSSPYFMFCLSVCNCFFGFFFFKQKTAYDMRISDWSSDVCSSDLGTPPDEDKGCELIGKSDLASLTADTVALVGALRMREGNGKVGVIGFCWGGAMVDRGSVAAGPALSAGVSYYGPAPDPAEEVKVSASMLLHYAGLDTRVAATGEPWVAALKAAGKDVTAYTYPGVNHAFKKDTSAERYDAEADRKSTRLNSRH